MDEEWKAIPGYEGLYDVSTHGNVRSYDRWVTRRSGAQVLWRGRTLKPNKGSKGHYRVNLFKDGVPAMTWIHRLVAQAFIPNPENHPLVRHLDDVKENNHVSNLAWGTHSDNRQDAIRNGVRFGVRNLEKTNCVWGHPYSGENLYINPKSGARSCRTCKREHWRKMSGKKTETSVKPIEEKEK